VADAASPLPPGSWAVCLITGAASGIGLATARAAARQRARLVLTDVSPLDDAANELGDSVVLARSLDITDIDAVRQLAHDVHANHGSLDVAMNIAGIATWGAVENLTHEQWRRTIDVNLMGPIHVIESFVPEMIKAGRGGQLAERWTPHVYALMMRVANRVFVSELSKLGGSDPASPAAR
jgi:NAD(P)-dependent dehydrogenase (short-subunit alcohol dehydrogenase family)